MSGDPEPGAVVPHDPGPVPRVVPVGDGAVLVELGDEVDDRVGDAVVELERLVAALELPGVIETVPAFVSLLVVFDPLVTDHRTVAAAITPLAAESRGDTRVEPTVHRVPICYDVAVASDLDELASTLGMRTDDVVAEHLGGEYRVAMYGFAPGAAYLSGVPEPIRIPRRPTAVPNVPAGSVIVAGPQCLVLPIDSRTGWWVIGRSPTLVVRPDDDDPFALRAGDRVVFERVDRDECARLERGAGRAVD